MIRAAQPQDAERVRTLMREYAAGLGVDLSSQDFDTEVADPPGFYELVLLAGDGRLRRAQADRRGDVRDEADLPSPFGTRNGSENGWRKPHRGSPRARPCADAARQHCRRSPPRMRSTSRSASSRRRATGTTRCRERRSSS